MLVKRHELSEGTTCLMSGVLPTRSSPGVGGAGVRDMGALSAMSVSPGRTPHSAIVALGAPARGRGGNPASRVTVSGAILSERAAAATSSARLEVGRRAPTSTCPPAPLTRTLNSPALAISETSPTALDSRLYKCHSERSRLPCVLDERCHIEKLVAFTWLCSVLILIFCDLHDCFSGVVGPEHIF